ncbi:hypothetical protein FXN63_12360 [Pigmentiphaga aceris]|uniref:Radical SAM protein n=1 Tax=Pigmentiphaga aceris TaxID=1940612 RepID=A0A5C0B6Y4_9BURK|nr:hypothetical protein FXN63_12360 [Pigmentiphaga aceris]
MIEASAAYLQLRARFGELALREPGEDEQHRWLAHVLNGQAYRFAQPLTFTPYASARACSARCRFCSETLIDESASGPMSASLRPGADYFDGLSRALRALRGVPLSYSLSGLENTDDPDWLLSLLSTLTQVGTAGPVIEDRVMYTNGAGLATDGARLLPALRNFGLSWLEWSRHHDDAAANQQIMRFRHDEAVMNQDVFERTLATAQQAFPVKLICIVQQGGIATATDVFRYLDWARDLGVQTVIFREFSVLPDRYRRNVTRRYIDDARVPIDTLLTACMADPAFNAQFQPLALTGGYYFWNARWRGPQGMEVVFETSDYGAMRAHEESGAVYKLVFHANGNLCSGWQPSRDVLWSAHEQQ